VNKNATNRPAKEQILKRSSCLIPLLMLLTLAGCNEYPAGAAVAIRIKGASLQFKPVAEFESWLMDRMTTFSKYKQDFTVVGGVLGDTESIPSGASHVFTISIDSVSLVPYQKYKGAVDTANMIADKSEGLAYLFQSSGFAGAVINKIAYGTQTHPTMGVSLSIRDVKTHQNNWDYSEVIDLESNAAIPENEQVGELFAVLKSLVADEAGFLKDK
jgi:hypothetical protein